MLKENEHLGGQKSSAGATERCDPAASVANYSWK